MYTEPIHLAVKRGHAEVIKLLLMTNPEFLLSKTKFVTPTLLYLAVECSDYSGLPIIGQQGGFGAVA